MATEQLPDGLPIERHAVVFGLFPGDPSFFTVVERDGDVGGAPGGSPVVVAWLEPGVRFYVEEHNSAEGYLHYRFRHGGFGFNFGEPTAWYRARPVAWNGEIPNLPREAFFDLDLLLDVGDGTVDIFANGDRSVASIKWDWSLVTFPASATQAVDTDAEGDATVVDAFMLQSGDTGHVTAEFYSAPSGGGILLGTLRASVTFQAEAVGAGQQIIFNCDFDEGSPGEGSFWAVANSLDASITLDSVTPTLGDGVDVTFASAGKSVRLVQVPDDDDDITKTVAL